MPLGLGAAPPGPGASPPAASASASAAPPWSRQLSSRSRLRADQRLPDIEQARAGRAGEGRTDGSGARRAGRGSASGGVPWTLGRRRACAGLPSCRQDGAPSARPARGAGCPPGRGEDGAAASPWPGSGGVRDVPCAERGRGAHSGTHLRPHWRTRTHGHSWGCAHSTYTHKQTSVKQREPPELP